MASNTNRQPCSKCEKGFAIIICSGCQQWMCFKHLNEHRHELQRAMDELGQEYDHLYQDLMNNDQTQHLLYSRINTWEQRSLERIREVANQARNQIRSYLTEAKDETSRSLRELAQTIQISREKDDYTEHELKQWSEQLNALRQQLEQTPLIEIFDDALSEDQDQPNLLRFLQVKQKTLTKNSMASRPSSHPFLSLDTCWEQHGVTVAGSHSHGIQLNQLSSPYSMDLDDQGTVFVADYNNHRVVAWKPGATAGEIVAGGNGKGPQLNQLCYPVAVLVDRSTNDLTISEWGNRRIVRWSGPDNNRTQKILVEGIRSFGLAMDRDNALYVSNWETHEVQRYELGSNRGTAVAGGNGRGEGLNQLDGPWGIFVDDERAVYIADRDNHRVVKWMKDAKEGVVVAGGKGYGSGLGQLNYPTSLFVDSFGSVYVAVLLNHRIMRWLKEAQEGSLVLGGQGMGNGSDSFSCPFGPHFDLQGNLYVVDKNNHRVQRFSIRRNQ